MTPTEALEVIKTITKGKDNLQELSFSQLEKIILMIDTPDKDKGYLRYPQPLQPLTFNYKASLKEDTLFHRPPRCTARILGSYYRKS